MSSLERVGRPQHPRAATATAPQRHQTILVAENEISNRHLMEQILGFAGYHCISAGNGLEALHALERERVDLVLLDLSMPVLDGYRTTELIRVRPAYAHLPVVAVSAHAFAENRDRAARSGCTDYLTKPFRPRDLLTLVARLLGIPASGQ